MGILKTGIVCAGALLAAERQRQLIFTEEP